MTEESKVISNDGQKENTDSSGIQNEKKEDVVSYETHKRLLAQRKADQQVNRELKAELDAIKQKQQEAEDAKLKEQGEYKKLLETREQRLKETEAERNDAYKLLTDTWKRQEIDKVLPGKIERDEYYSFIDFEKIAFDPETKRVDKESVQMAVNEFMENHPSLIKKVNDKRLPSSPTVTTFTNSIPSYGSSKEDFKNFIKNKISNINTR